MSKIFYIQASPRAQRSKSLKVADAFIAEYSRIHTDDQVETLNVFDKSIPDFDGLAVQAKYTILHGQSHSQEELTAWKEVEKIIEQFKSADKYLLAIPMWNFSIPYRLKQYIDILVQPGYTFSFDNETGYQGLVVEKPVLVVYARGGEYKTRSDSAAFDLQKRYIELILGFIGFDNIRSVVVEPTLQAGPDVANDILKEAIDKAKKIANDF
jgi:FMN-dependent NADH-azoreductase